MRHNVLRNTAITLYILIVVCMGLASVIEKYHGNSYAYDVVYGSWWFTMIWALLAAVGIAYCVQRRMKRLALLALHASFVLILAGAALTHFASQQGFLHLRLHEGVDWYYTADGNDVKRLPMTFTLEKFEIEYHDNTDMVKDFVTTMTLSDGSHARVSMNKPYVSGGLRLVQNSYDDDLWGSVLYVNIDPYGIPVTYCGYAILFISLVWMIAEKRGIFRRTLRHTLPWYVVYPLLAAVFVAVYFLTEVDEATIMAMPVLRSPLLAVHVSVIMMAYTLFLVMAVLAVVAICSRSSTERMTHYSLLMLPWAIAFLCIGIFIGAVWANVSWGTYWSWDPKETWALITLLIYAAPLHAASIPAFAHPRTYNIYMLCAFLSVIITYFGVNYLLGGIHSYA